MRHPSRFSFDKRQCFVENRGLFHVPKVSVLKKRGNFFHQKVSEKGSFFFKILEKIKRPPLTR